jgi:hypothetical protein
MQSAFERINLALNHQEPDQIPFDLGGSKITGMHVCTVYKLRQALALDPPGTPVKVIDPFQMLGELENDIFQELGIIRDVAPLEYDRTIFGFKNEDWKRWDFFDGTPLLVPAKFSTRPNSKGAIFMYPDGDTSARPSGIMPAGSWYFDIVDRQLPLGQRELRVEDNQEEFRLIDDEEVNRIAGKVDEIKRQSDKAILAWFGSDTDFGDIATISAPWLKNPKGIRGIEEWYMSLVSRKQFIYQIFERQCEIGIANLEKIYKAVGNSITAVIISAADFGMQSGLMISPKTYRDLFYPFHSEVNRWVHQNTGWKTFIHTDGSVATLLEDLIEAGFDILNPIQISATGMELMSIKDQCKGRIVLWGAAVDPHNTLTFGTPNDVRIEIMKNIEILAPGGGFICAPIHNIQADVPIANIMSMFECLRYFQSSS